MHHALSIAYEREREIIAEKIIVIETCLNRVSKNYRVRKVEETMSDDRWNK